MTKVENVYSVNGILIEGLKKAIIAQCEADLIDVFKTTEDSSIIEILASDKETRKKVIEVLIEMEDLV